MLNIFITNHIFKKNPKNRHQICPRPSLAMSKERGLTFEMKRRRGYNLHGREVWVEVGAGEAAVLQRFFKQLNLPLAQREALLGEVYWRLGDYSFGLIVCPKRVKRMRGWGECSTSRH